MPTDPVHPERRKSDRAAALGYRRVWLPVFAVMIALGASLVVPGLMRAREQAYRRELQDVILPARELTRERREALQRGSSARVGYVASRNPTMLATADSLAAQADSLGRAMRTILEGTWPETRRALGLLARAEARVAALRPGSEPSSAELYRLLPAVHAEQELVLAAFDSIDAALVSEMVLRERRLDELERFVGMVNGFLALLGIAAVLSVARLTRDEQRARAQSEAAVRARDEVVSIVSHDLRNPLSTVTMAAGFLLETLPGDEDRRVERKQLEIIRRAAESMNRMIQDLLDIARIESGRLTVERARVPAELLVEEAVELMRPVAEREGRRLLCEVPGELPHVEADRERVLQIFSNLVGNAVKFTPPGGTITVGAEVEDSRVWFHVADTGVGIPPQNLPHLFDRFWQATRSDRRGIGLGLPIVKGLVEAQGGAIRVASTVGEGTTFSFSVERAD